MAKSSNQRATLSSLPLSQSTSKMKEYNSLLAQEVAENSAPFSYI
jgi:hypothetical protein